MYEQQTQRLAELLVGFGANVQKGQIVIVGAEMAHAAIAREVVERAYQHGAKYVELTYGDLHTKHARIQYGSPDELEFVPSWSRRRAIEVGEQRCARIAITGPSEPHLLDDLDPVLVGRENSAPRKESGEVTSARQTNWTIGPYPVPGWAQLVHPDLDPDAALAKLWQEIEHVCRLDCDDPVAAWQERMRTLTSVATKMTAQRFDALHFTGPGTDLTVGLMPSSKWICAEFETIDGIVHAPNIPSEEIFTTPDPKRTEGVVHSTKPLMVGGSIIEGLEVEFAGGRVKRIDATRGADTMRALVERDEGAAQLGEVALVDGEGRIGKLGTVFYNTLLDENAASHIALGKAYDFALESDDDVALANKSKIHTDFMIGSNDVVVHGVKDGSETLVLQQGIWQL